MRPGEQEALDVAADILGLIEPEPTHASRALAATLQRWIDARLNESKMSPRPVAREAAAPYIFEGHIWFDSLGRRVSHIVHEDGTVAAIGDLARAMRPEEGFDLSDGERVRVTLESVTAAEKRPSPPQPSPERMQAYARLEEAARALLPACPRSERCAYCDPEIAGARPPGCASPYHALSKAIAVLDAVRIAGPRDAADPPQLAPFRWHELTEAQRKQVQETIDWMVESKAESERAPG